MTLHENTQERANRSDACGFTVATLKKRNGSIEGVRPPSIRFWYVARQVQEQNDRIHNVARSETIRSSGPARILLFSPSTAPLQISPFARNQFRVGSSHARSIRANFFTGSYLLRIARNHPQFRNAAAQLTDSYVRK